MQTSTLRYQVIGILFILVLLALLIFPAGQMRSAHPANLPDSLDLTPAVPLPEGCPETLPPGSIDPCMRIGVMIEGQLVSGAKLTFAAKEKQVTLFTEEVETSVDKRPHCTIALSNALGVRINDTITITAEYMGRTATITHTVVTGGQERTIPLPRQTAQDHTFDAYALTPDAAISFAVPWFIATTSNGEIYITDGKFAHVWAFGPTGNLLTHWGSVGNLAGQFGVLGGIAVDPEDNIYVTDPTNKQVHKFSSTGLLIDSWESEVVKKVQFAEPKGIASDQNGNVYVADRGSRRILMFDKSGNFQQGWDIRDKNNGQLLRPSSIAVDRRLSVIYIVDADHQRILKFTNGLVEAMWPALGYGNGQLYTPVSIAVDVEGFVYVTGNDDRVHKLDASGNVLPDPISVGPVPRRFNQPTGVALTSAQDIYVTDNYCLRGFKSAGGTPVEICQAQPFYYPIATAIDNNDNPYFLRFEDLTGEIEIFDRQGKFRVKWNRDAENFNNPADIAVDNNGNVYVVGTGSHPVIKISPDGTPSYLPVSGGVGSGAGQLLNPKGVAVTKVGKILVADTGNRRIQIWDEVKQAFVRWDRPCPGDNTLYSPRGIIADNAGNIYVTDPDNRRVLKFNQNGDCVPQWGNPKGANVPVINPQDIAVDNNGNVYVSEGSTERVVVFDSTGTFITGLGGPGSGDGRFVGIASIAIDSKDNLYANDGSARIQLLKPMTYSLPIATITEISANARNLGPNDRLIVRGEGQVSDTRDEILGCRWKLDNDDNRVISTSCTLDVQASQLNVTGAHYLTFEVVGKLNGYSRGMETLIYVRPYLMQSPTTTPTPTPTAGPGATPTATAKPGVTVTPTPTPDLTVPTAWAFLIYLVCDKEDGGRLMAECERVIEELKTVSNPNLRIAVLIDGSKSIGTPKQPDTYLWLFRPGIAPTRIPYGEQKMDEPDTLGKFIQTAQRELPAEHYYLVIADHGQGVQGIGWDDSSGSINKNFLKVREIAEVLKDRDILPIDVIHFDACSMGLIEVAHALRQNPSDSQARYLITSEFLVWSYFGYVDYQTHINASTTPAEFAQAVIEDYAREMKKNGLPHAVAVWDLRRVEALNVSLQRFIKSLEKWLKFDDTTRKAKRKLLQQLREASQIFESDNNFVTNPLDSYVDLEDWVTRIQQGGAVGATVLPGIQDPNVQLAATNLISAFHTLRLVHLQDDGKITLKYLPLPWSQDYAKDYPDGIAVSLTRAHGAAIYYPYSKNDPLPGTAVTAWNNVSAFAQMEATPTPAFDEAYRDYINDVRFDFTLASLWDEFLEVAVGVPSITDTLAPPPEPLPPLSAPSLSAVQTHTLQIDTDPKGVVSPGDILRVETIITNTGGVTVTNVRLIQEASEYVTLVPEPAPFTAASTDSPTTTIPIGNIGPNATVTVSFQANLSNNIPITVTTIQLKATVGGDGIEASSVKASDGEEPNIQIQPGYRIFLPVVSYGAVFVENSLNYQVFLPTLNR